MNKQSVEPENSAACFPMETIVMPLNLKKQWFDMVLSGEKHEEYREIKDYWARRFLNVVDSGGMEWQAWEEMWQDMRYPFKRHNGPAELMEYFGVSFKAFDVIRFRNGYRKNAPEFFSEFNGFEIKQGAPSWGAEPEKYYFVLKLGAVVEAHNG